MCECIAGLCGSCKHISAVVCAVNEEDCSTKTSNSCEWNKPSTSKIVPKKYSKGKRFAEMFPKPKHVMEKPKQISVEQILHIPCMLHTMLAAENTCGNISLNRLYLIMNMSATIKAFAIFCDTKRNINVLLLCLLLFLFCSSDIASQMEVTQDSQDWEQLFNLQGSSKLLKVLANETFQVISDCCIETYRNAVMGNPLEICRNTFNNQTQWMKERKYRITASRCYSLFTYSCGDWQT